MPRGKISHYRILRRLGSGAHGTVHLARDLNFDRTVAIKSLNGELIESPNARTRFLREAEAISKIDHPHVVVLYDVIDEADGLHLVMQHIEGQSLRDRIRQRAFTIDEVIRLITEVAEGLEAAHARGIVHRDLKPANVLLGSDGRCKIADFGLAHFFDDRTTLRGENGIVGTPAYMAPEQRRGEEVDERADIYALGCILEELLSKCPNAPRRLRHLIDAAKAPMPSDRIASARAFRERLQPRRRRSVPAVALAVLVLALFVSAWPSLVDLLHGDATQAAPRIVVAPFTNAAQREDLDWLSTAMMDNLIGSLGSMPGLRLISRQTVSAALGDTSMHGIGIVSERLEELVQRMGADYLISGSFSPYGDGLRIHCEIVDSNSGEVLASWPFDIDSADRDLLGSVDSMARSIAETLKVHAPLGDPTSHFFTASIQALQHFEEGMQALRRDDYGMAVAGFRRAVAADSSYARAYMMLWESSPDPELREWGIRQAMRYRHGAPDPFPELIEASYASQRSPGEAIQRYQTLLARYPDLQGARNRLGILYLQERRWPEAIGELYAARELNPYDYSFLQTLVAALVESDRTPEARAQLLDWRRARPEDSAPLTNLAEFSWWTGDYGSALSYCDSLALVRAGADASDRALALQFLGRARESERVLIRWSRLERREGRFMRSTPLTLLALLYLEMERLDDSQEYVRRSLATQDNFLVRWVAGKVSIARGDLLQAQGHADALALYISGDPGDSTVTEALQYRRWYCDIAGQIALAQGRPRIAVRWHAQACRASGRTDAAYFAPPLGDAYLALGDTTRAIEAYDEALTLNLNYYPPRLRLGRIALARGDISAAHAALDPLLELWADADPDFPPAKELRALEAQLRDLERERG